jgi:hypothetical protein
LDTLEQLDQKNDMANGLTTATAKLPTVTKAVPASQLPGVSKLPVRKPSGHTTNINKRGGALRMGPCLLATAIVVPQWQVQNWMKNDYFEFVAGLARHETGGHHCTLMSTYPW